jgi:hypothetical protein
MSLASVLVLLPESADCRTSVQYRWSSGCSAQSWRIWAFSHSRASARAVTSLSMAITGVELLALTLVPLVGRFVLEVQKFSY